MQYNEDFNPALYGRCHLNLLVRGMKEEVVMAAIGAVERLPLAFFLSLAILFVCRTRGHLLLCGRSLFLLLVQNDAEEE